MSTTTTAYDHAVLVAGLESPASSYCACQPYPATCLTAEQDPDDSDAARVAA